MSESKGAWRFNYDMAHFFEYEPDGKLKTKAVCGFKAKRVDEPAFPNAHLGHECAKCLAKLKDGSGPK